MPNYTDNLGLIQPLGSEKIRIAQINQNMDTLDEAIGAVGERSLQQQILDIGGGIAIIANNNTHPAITAGQFVFVRNHSTLADGAYTANSNIAENAALSSSNLTAVPGGGFNALKAGITSLSDQINNSMKYVTSGSLHDIKGPGVYSIASAVTDKPTSNGGTYVVSSYSNGVLVGGTYTDVVTGDSYSINLYNGNWTYRKNQSAPIVAEMNNASTIEVDVGSVPTSTYPKFFTVSTSQWADGETHGAIGFYRRDLSKYDACVVAKDDNNHIFEATMVSATVLKITLSFQASYIQVCAYH